MYLVNLSLCYVLTPFDISHTPVRKSCASDKQILELLGFPTSDKDYNYNK